ncbi:C45 family autoproteolytic acyltransferase/hydolase [Aequorivita capsosiphonis]|uniref:C45 family autoproteolytic acyltransferase/hydolase n=1 Tax=Aequorivita capsosiphonis TaxID=487317 RepID=UPI000429CEB8|nr:C45 family peptidase [Aequorivita capsosiphonis]
MLQLNFHSISEAKPGEKWQQLFQKHWPAYKAWFQSKGAVNNPPLSVAKAKLQEYMPKFVPTYEKLCKLGGNDPIAERFLTGFQPPAYISGCSQVITQNPPMLVRNYDYHPHLSEGTLLNTSWNGKRVIGINDCLWGLVDGMNSDGLVVSLTFGGRKVVGEGFGIPFIIRYVLEFCSNVEEATEVLQQIPSHMAYNVMVLDKTGNHKLVQLAPDRKPIVTEMPLSTNHQGKVDWPQHAQFSKTLEREAFINKMISEKEQEPKTIINAFSKSPLFNRKYNEGFGTVYTSIYHPADGKMQLKWDNRSLSQSFADFEEGEILITYSEIIPAEKVSLQSTAIETHQEVKTPTASTDWEAYGKSWATQEPVELAQMVVKTIGAAMGISDGPILENIMKEMTSESKKRGQIPWEMLADIWSSLGKAGKE